MKILCVIFSLLLAVANLVNSYFCHGVNVVVVLWSIVMTVCYLRILYTSSAENVVYETWKKLLPKDNAEIKHNIKISTIVLVVSYVVYILLQRWKWFAGLDSAWGFIMLLLLATPMILASLLYGTGKTIKEAKSYFGSVVEILVTAKGFEHLKERREQLTPDTPLLQEIVITNRNAWCFNCVINDLIDKYNILYSDNKDERKMWNNFVCAINNGAMEAVLETEEDIKKYEEFIDSGLDCAKLFCAKHKTLGGIAIWIAESKRYQSLEQFANSAN